MKISSLHCTRWNFHHCSYAVKEKLYLTLVCPHLEYATTSWDPFTVKNISSIKKVQRQAACFVTNTYRRDTSVTKLLNQPDCQSTLQVRRETHHTMYFYKMINNQLDIDYQSHIETRPDRRRRGHSNQFVIPAANTDVYANSYFPRILRMWNNLLQSTNRPDQPHSCRGDPGELSYFYILYPSAEMKGRTPKLNVVSKTLEGLLALNNVTVWANCCSLSTGKV